jgi:predicted outer membrane repeat protein
MAIFEGTIFFGNEAFVGGALMVSSISNVIFCGENTFLYNNASHNKGGAIYASDSFLNMTGVQNFKMNIAHNGGAMTLSGSTKLILSDVLLNFIKNYAMNVGGAMYIEDTNSIPQYSQSECFLELTSLLNIKFNFSYNSAGISGSILYGDGCGNKQGGYYVNNPLGLLKNNISYIVSDTNGTLEFSSKPHKVCVCDNKNMSENCGTQIDLEAKVITGMEISIWVATIGVFEQIVPSSIQISPNNDIQVSAKQHVQTTTEECTLLNYSLFSNVIQKDTTLVLQLKDVHVFYDQISIRVYFSPCPSGFILNKVAMKCVCDERLQLYTTDCRIVSESMNYIERKSNTFWMGASYDNKTYKGLILHTGCPFDYCVDTPVNITLDDLDVQCEYNHSGVLCGSCKHGLSIAFGTLHCIPCSNSYISLVVPFAFAGLALVAILFLLNLSVSNGMINGLIFYANIVQANHSGFFPSLKEHSDVLSVFIAWINLDIGIETCFYDGMTVYAFTWLQFLFPFYVWFLIALIIVLSRFSDRVANSLGSNPVATLATLLLVSYSKILRSIIAVFTVATLEYPDDTHKYVWLYDGSVQYFKRRDHIVLGVFAIMVSVFLFLPYTLLLLCGHWLQAFSNRWMFGWLNKIKPFMDAYYAPYKKHTRFWISLLLTI